MSSDDELRMYMEQADVIQEQIRNATDDREREELEEAKRDLEELIALLNENVEETTADTPSEENETVQEELDIDYDELVGLRVSAAPKRFDLPISHHAAIVLEVLPGKSTDDLMAKVLFSAPLLAAMKPCPHFLSGTCKFNEKCRFSHGELVSMQDFEDYQEPDYSNLQDGSLVLVSIEGGLWDIGRVQRKEIGTTIEKIIPLDAEIEVQEEREKIVEHHNTSWSELKGQTCGNVKVGELGNWTGGGLGLKLMQKMGYKIGEGLGKNSDGIVHAVQAVVYKKQKGLDTKADGKPADKNESTKKRVKKALEQKSIGFDCDIFQFLNRKLQNDEANDTAKLMKEEQQEMNKCTEKEIGIRGLDIESEIKELRSKEKKLREVRKTGK
ncbi:unnamed protein product [Auanema sp. JU1783]|nr:unnamed protein product [Auanema sp. JU1783]